MSMTLDKKAHAFAGIMKSIGYQGNINMFTIRSLIDIPDIREFFDWFLSNVNENWLLTSEQKFWFKEKDSKGQVVYDVEKLKNTNRMINEDKFTSLDEIERENALLEEELEMLSSQLDFKQKQKSMLNDELTRLKKLLVWIFFLNKPRGYYFIFSGCYSDKIEFS
jgi:lipase chaperone LimK